MMRCRTVTCLPITPTLGRRAVLAGATALVGVAAFRPAAGDQLIAIAAVVDADGKAGPVARGLSGRPITLMGYLAPPLTPAESWQLTEGPAMPCPLCGAMHDIGASLTIEFASPPDPSLTSLQAVTVSGRIDIQGSGSVRLVDARVDGA